jgi:glucose-1-phosphate adenylyltransferase
MHAQVPDGARVGRNVAIRPRTAAKAFPKDGVVASGSTL